jgi:regulator of protease activity HflC (stomatin/prohibitin superfamily)
VVARAQAQAQAIRIVSEALNESAHAPEAAKLAIAKEVFF